MQHIYQTQDRLIVHLFEYTKDCNLEIIQETFKKVKSTRPSLVPRLLRSKDVEGRTLFHWACFNGAYDVICFYLECGDPDKSHDIYGYSAFDLAVIKGRQERGVNEDTHQNQLKISMKLVEVGFEVKVKKKGIMTCLHWACYNDNFQLVKYLVLINERLMLDQTVDSYFPVDYIFAEYKDSSMKRNQMQIFEFLICWHKMRHGVKETMNGFLSKSEIPSIIEWFTQNPETIDSEPSPQNPYRSQGVNILLAAKAQASFLISSQKSSSRFNQTREKTTTKSSMILETGDESPTYRRRFMKPRVEKQFAKPVVSQNIQELPEQEQEDIAIIESKSQDIPEEYIILDPEEQLTVNQKYELRLLYWSSYVGNTQFVKYLLQRKANPFQLDYQGMSAYHVSAYEGQSHIIKIYLDSQFVFLNPKNVFDKSEEINKMADQQYNSALHMAVEKNHPSTVQYLLAGGCDIDAVNFRTLTPFELTRNEQIRDMFQDLRPFDLLNFAEIGFYYVLRAPTKRKEECIVYVQLMNIKNKLSELGLDFDFILIYSRDKKEHYYHYVIRVSEVTLQYYAEQLEMKCYNLKLGIRQIFRHEKKDDFEQFQDIQIQHVITHILNDEFEVDVFLQQGILHQIYPFHDFQKRLKLNQFWHDHEWDCLKDTMRLKTKPIALKPLQSISNYYGPKVGWYFSFLCHMTSSLVIPSILGIGLALYMLIIHEFVTGFMPLYSLMINIWGSAFLESWKRRESELALFWDMHEYQQSEPIRYQYQGQYVIDYVTERIRIKSGISAFTKRLTMEGPIVILGLVILFFNFLLFLQVIPSDKSSFSDLVVLGVINGMALNVLAFIYRKICQVIVEWENHEHQSTMEMSYVFKIFVFEFFNSYLQPVYQAVYIGDYMLLTTSVGSIIITRGLIHNALTNLVPILKHNFLKVRFYKQHFKYLRKHSIASRVLKTLKRQRTIQEYIEHQVFDFKEQDIADQTNSSIKLNLTQLISFQEQLEYNNVMLDHKDLIDEYMYLAIQFGYITLFAPVFPVAPLFVMINFYLNLRFSMYAYQHQMKRELGEQADGIGIWNYIFGFMNYFSTVMNCVIIYTTNKESLANLIGPGTTLRDAIFLFFIEHTLLMVKFFFDLIIPDNPEWVIKTKRKIHWLEQRQFDLHLKKSDQD